MIVPSIGAIYSTICTKLLIDLDSRDCVVSNWEGWSECNTDCGIGIMRRKRKVLEYPKNGGKKCPPLRQTRGCNKNTLCVKNNNNCKYFFIVPFILSTFLFPNRPLFCWPWFNDSLSYAGPNLVLAEYGPVKEKRTKLTFN